MHQQQQISVADPRGFCPLRTEFSENSSGILASVIYLSIQETAAQVQNTGPKFIT